MKKRSGACGPLDFEDIFDQQPELIDGQLVIEVLRINIVEKGPVFGVVSIGQFGKVE